MEWIMGLVLAGSTLIQGGFYPAVFLAAGFVCAIISLVRAGRGIQRAEVVFWSFSALCLLTSVINGYDAAGLAQAALPLAVAFFLRAILSVEPEKRRRLADILCFLSGIFAVIALAAVSGVVALRGAVSAGRIQFPFQYANASGAWFGATLILTEEKRDKVIVWTRLPVLAALLLTRSVGAIGVYCLGMAAGLALSKNRRAKWPYVVIFHALGVLCALAIVLLPTFPAFLAIAVTVAGSLMIDKFMPLLIRYKFQWIFLLLAVIGIVPVILSQRIASAAGTFAERLLQIHDGLAIVADHPLFGIGAGNWTRIYRTYQTAQYTSNAVHSGLVEFAVDGGVVTAVAFFTFIVMAFAVRGRKPQETIAAGLIGFHSLFDFTLRFFPILCLLVLCLFAGAPVIEEKKGEKIFRRLFYAMVSVLLLFLSVTEQIEKAIVFDAGDSDWEAVRQNYTSFQTVLGNSPQPKLIYGFALISEKNPEQVPGLYRSVSVLTTEELSLVANSYMVTGNEEKAYEILLSSLENRLFDVELFDETRSFLERNRAPNEITERFDSLAEQANNRKSLLGSLTGTQVQIKKINSKGETK